MALAVLVSACTQTQVVIEPAPDAGGGDTPPGATALTISISDKHTCAIAQGALYCWGANDEGRLGIADGDTTRRLWPTRVGTDSDWKAVATGDTSTLALKTDGTMWSFGGNDWGQLGLGDRASRSTPDGPIGGRADWTAIATRFNHACALAKDGALWCWGANDEGQLGQDDVMSADTGCRAPSTDSICRYLPTQVPTYHDFVAVDTGQGHTCALRTDGTLWCWGRNSDGELAQEGGNVPVQRRRPVQVGMATNWQVVRSGQNTTCGVRGGVAFCWGRSFGMDNVVGIPGVAQETFVSTQTDIGGPPGVVDLSFHTFGGAVRDAKGGVWVWGRNVEGQLGLGNAGEHFGVIQVDDAGWSQVSVGHFANCGVRRGRPVCAGKNDDGWLGQGDTSRRDEFTDVMRLP